MKDQIWTIEGKIVAVEEASAVPHVLLRVEVSAGAWDRWQRENGRLPRHSGGQRVRIIPREELAHGDPDTDRAVATTPDPIRELRWGQNVPQTDVQRGGGEESGEPDGAERQVRAVYRPRAAGDRVRSGPGGTAVENPQ